MTDEREKLSASDMELYLRQIQGIESQEGLQGFYKTLNKELQQHPDILQEIKNRSRELAGRK